MDAHMPDLEMHKIKLEYYDTSINDPERTTTAQLKHCCPEVHKGMKIAIAVGSRGIADIAIVTKATVEYVKSRGAQPVLIPAMGSHGGATPQGQKNVLAEYGITEMAMGAPVNASMDVVTIDNGIYPFNVFMSKPAWEADGVIVINRIKPHTDYHGHYESGLTKMLVIGLGKHAQALEMHKYGVKGLREYLPDAARCIAATGKIMAGVGLIENRSEQLCHIEVIPGSSIMHREPALLKIAAENMPLLPVKDIDLLIVDYIGKNFSGTGLDTNIVGRIRIPGENEPDYPSVKRIFVRDISPQSHGNALGIGLADVITRKLFDQINFEVMYENAITSTFLERVKIPLVASDDRQAVLVALRSCGPVPHEKLRIVRIQNTLHINELYVSNAVYESLYAKDKQLKSQKTVSLFEGTTIPEF
jgi:hypothetical protein